jgi:transcription antitermination factor NusG
MPSPVDSQPSAPARPWLAAAGKWFVLRTRSRQEKALTEDLAARKFACYLPLCTVVRYYGKRKAKAVLPLFSGYVFLKGDRDQAFIADRTGRIAQILDVTEQERLERELVAIADALDREGSLTPCEPLTRGTEVEVTSGPFKGIRGQVDVATRDNRLILHVDLIGGAAALEIDRDLLHPVTE